MTDKLPVEHIKVGNFLWYGGNTSMFGWDCPAKIMTVKDGVFTVMSLDDMKVQTQTYRIVCGPHEPESRLSMRAITKEEAHAYMRKVLDHNLERLEKIEEKYERDTADAKRAIAEIESELV